MDRTRQLVGVTGAGGFVGRLLCPWLTERGFEVRSLPRGLDPAADVMAGLGAVVHLAGRAHVMRESGGDTLGTYREANVDLTRRALEAAARAGAGLFVLASSVKAVGERSDTAWTETVHPSPCDPYGMSKLEAEHLIAERGRALGIRTVALRFPLMYGPGMRANMLRLFRAVDRGLPLPFGGLTNRRSLLFAGNAAQAIATVLSSGPGGASVYFVSDDHDVSTGELVAAIARALGRPARLLMLPPGVFRAAGRLGDVLARLGPWPLTSAAVGRLTGSLAVDPSLIKRELGYQPAYSLEEGMRVTAAWYREARPTG
jgi:UDP-N-acetyl-alpha-D-quinovosamine dehydrogenase